MPDIAVAIVIPTLDEEESLRASLPVALEQADDLVVSDGGSGDGTLQVARDLGARVTAGTPGRGTQLNRGARAVARADALLFLHADTRLPPTAVAGIRRAVAAGRVGGGFLVRFDSGRSIFRLGERLVDLRTRLTGAPLGDQAQFATREAFEHLGGFEDWPILEDLDFIRRLKRCGETAVLPQRVTTSARRYLRQGVLRTVAINWSIWALFFLGMPPHRLARLYRQVR